MFQVPSDVFALASEPVVICQSGVIAFANDSAMEILGRDCVGEYSDAVFGSELSGTQSSSFIADLPIGGKYYILRVSKSGAFQTIFFTHQTDVPLILNDAFIYSLRSHLMNISISANFIRERAETCGDKQMLDSLSALTRSYYSINRLMNNASTVRSIADNALPFSPREINVSEICTKPLETLRWIYPEYEFSFNIGKDIILCADPSLINLLLGNLLANCLARATNVSRIAVSLFEAQGSVILSVSDDGCGIPKGELYSVFDRFRYNFGMDRVSDGAGLGLTVARGIAAIHGGTLLLESREGHGTTVRASFKQGAFSPSGMKAPQIEYFDGLESMLIGLADCLPKEMFKEKYLD